MAYLIELEIKDYENVFRDERQKQMPKQDFSNILTHPDFQELTKNLLENHKHYALTEGEVYCIQNEYFRWNGQKMVQVPDAEITEEMKDDRLELTSDDYEEKFEEEYEDETDYEMPDFENIDFKADFEKWVYKALVFKRIIPEHGDVIAVNGDVYRNRGKYQWDGINNKLVDLYRDLDDYGSCNPMFRVGDNPGEFSPRHWLNSIEHNSIVFLSNELIDEINTKLVPVERGYKCDIKIQWKHYMVYTKKSKLDPKKVHDCAFYYNASEMMLIQVDC